MRAGSIIGVEVVILPIVPLVSLVLWIALSAVALWALGMSPGMALLFGLLVMLLHWVSEIVHDIGHALAARGAGYPMQRILVGGTLGLLAISSYPAYEPALQDSIHVRRAVGGPIASFITAIIFGAIALLLHGLLWWVAIFLFV